MGVNAAQLIDASQSHLMRLGLFESVNGHEATTPPSSGGLRAAVWGQRLGPVPQASGLDITTARLILQNRIYSRLNEAAPDAIEPAVIGATDLLMEVYTGDFTFDGLIMEIDLLNAYGVPLEAVAGYLRLGDDTLRVMTITVPCIVENAWIQAP